MAALTYSLLVIAILFSPMFMLPSEAAAPAKKPQSPAAPAQNGKILPDPLPSPSGCSGSPSAGTPLNQSSGGKASGSAKTPPVHSFAAAACPDCVCRAPPPKPGACCSC